MNGFGTAYHLDAYAMIEATRGATRAEALKLREIWRMQLRWLEDVHGLPHSFQMKNEQGQEYNPTIPRREK